MEEELNMIIELMEGLKEEMSYNEDDISERLGKPKASVEVMSLEGDMPEEEMEEDLEVDPMAMLEEPKSDLKNRLSKLKGK